MKRTGAVLGLSFALVASAFVCVRDAMPAFAAPPADGYVGKGTLVIQTSIGGDSKLTVGGNIAFEERDPQIRIDVLSLGIPGMDPTTSALLSTQLFPPGGFTVIYDRKLSTYTVWSNAKRNYFTPPASARPTTAPSATANANAASAPANGLLAVFGFLQSLKDDKAFALSLSLTGHGTVIGHPATGLTFSYTKTTLSNETTDLHGQLQLADDLGEIPISIAASLKSPTIPQSSFKLDATAIAQSLPPPGDFNVPAGYARAASLGDVIGKVLPQ